MPAERLPASDCRTRDASRPSDPSLTGQEGTINDISEETISFKTADFVKEVKYTTTTNSTLLIVAFCTITLKSSNSIVLLHRPNALLHRKTHL